MNRIARIGAAAVAGLALVIGVGMAATPAAVAGTPGYVTQAEWHKVNQGMAMTKVHRIVGTTGKLTHRYGNRGQERKYPVNSRVPSAGVTVYYERHNGVWKAEQAAAFFGPPKSPGYVSDGEYAAVRKGMTIKQIHRIFETKGKQYYRDRGFPAYGLRPGQAREYPTKSKSEWVRIAYENFNGTWKVTNKWLVPYRA